MTTVLYGWALGRKLENDLLPEIEFLEVGNGQ